MKKIFGIAFLFLSILILSACSNQETVQATFKDVVTEISSFTVTIEIVDPEAEITGVISVKVYDSNSILVNSKDITTDSELVGYSVTQLTAQQTYTLKVFATIERDVKMIGEIEITLPSAELIQITTPEEFFQMKDFRSGNYVLANDLDFLDKEFESPFTNFPFSGTFDGQGFKISNVNITKVNAYTGIFGYISTGKVENFTIENMTIGTDANQLIMQTSSNVGFVTGFISASTGLVKDVVVKDSMINYKTSSTVQAFVGAIVGQNKGEVINVEVINSKIEILATSYGRIRVGGAVGLLTEDSKLKQANIDTDVKVVLQGAALRDRDVQVNVGGVIGQHNARNFNKSVENIFSTSNIEVILDFGTAVNTSRGNYSVYVGGLAGIAYSNIVNAVFAGSISLSHDKNEYEEVVNKAFSVGGIYGFYGSSKVNASVLRYGNGNEMNLDISDDVSFRSSILIGESIATTEQNVRLFGTHHIVLNDLDISTTDTVLEITSLTDFFTSDFIKDLVENLS
jgi:hypothetical protein